LKTARLAVLAAAALSACGAPEPRIGKLALVDAAGSGEVVVARPSAFIAEEFPFYVAVNDENVAALHARQHIRFRLAAGEQRIAIRCPNMLQSDLNERVTTQRVVAGQTLYLSVTPQGNCASIEPVSEPQGRKLVSSTLFRPL